MTFMRIVGIRIKELRSEKGLSQLKVAQAIGTSSAIVGFWENDKAEPTAPNIAALAKFFNVTTDYLLGLENEDGSKI